MARRGCTCGVCEAANQPAVCAACVNLRLTEKYKLLRRLRQERDSLRRRLDAELKAKREAGNQQYWKVEHAERASKLLEHLHKSENLLVQSRLKREKMRTELEARTNLVIAASAQMSARKVELLEHFYPDLIRAQTLNCTAVFSELNQQRRYMFRHLSKVFPLYYPQGDSVYGEKPPPASKEKTWGQHLRICGACLPIRDDPHSVSPTELSASLGYMVQLVNQFARYLSAPILHNTAFAASSSRIWQRASYWDIHPSSRSEEYPLFLFRKGGGSSTPVEVSIRIDKHGSASESGFFPLEKTGSLIRSRSSGSFGRSSLGQNEADKDVKQGLKLLKRSICCICAYGYAMLSLPAPSTMSTFEALMELLSLFSSKEGKRRSTRPVLQSIRPDGSFLQSGFSSHIQDTETSRNQGKSRMVGMSDFFCIGADSRNREGFGKIVESMVDEWDVIDHPILPPPSQSEDVEHWTRAMIIDATK